MGRLAVILLVYIWAGLISCSEKTLIFNEQMVGLVKEMRLAFDGYISELDLYMEFYEVNPALLDQENRRMEEILSRVKRELQEIDVPDSETCRLFYDTSLKYAESGLMLASAYHVTTAYIKEHNPARNSDLEFLRNKLNPLYRESKQVYDELLAAQKAMAQQHGLELEY
jgi:hypothetical protein